MPIYSVNRTGSRGFYTEGTKRGYNGSNFGRILYESEINSMKIFEAALANDFKEIDARRENVLVESEIRAFAEASEKSAWETIRSFVMTVFNKIFEALKAVKRFIMKYIFNSGKAHVEAFNLFWKRNSEKADPTQAIEDKVAIYNGKDYISDISNKMDSVANSSRNYITSALNNTTIPDPMSDEEKYNELQKFVGTGSDIVVNSSSNFKKALALKYFDINDGKIYLKDLIKQIDHCITTLSNPKDSINKINEVEKKCKELLKKTLTDLKDAQKDSETGKANKGAVSYINKQIGAYQSIITILSSAALDLIKTDIKNSRRILGLIMKTVKNKTAVNDAARIYNEMEELADNAATDMELDDTISTCDDTEECDDTDIDTELGY